mmetsp:Transcript_10904/g.20546  ORF Transcript_10904/g.20546 Transcript_10904/m.20546 type:complete len:204 (+) Transcript_10904:60-671(+)
MSVEACYAEDEDSSGSSSSWFQRLRKAVPRMTEISDSEDSDGTPSEMPLPNAVLTVGHAYGNCNPCVLFSTRRGCSRGHGCSYCHMPHVDKQKTPHRPRKQTRDKYKQTIVRLLSENQDDVDRAQHQLQELCRRSPYLRSLLQGLLDGDRSRWDTANVPSVNHEGAVVRLPGRQPPSLSPSKTASSSDEVDTGSANKGSQTNK